MQERDFFFGILCTLKNQYMKDVIQDANNKRFKAIKCVQYGYDCIDK